jgi:hypothetical protein
VSTFQFALVSSSLFLPAAESTAKCIYVLHRLAKSGGRLKTLLCTYTFQHKNQQQQLSAGDCPELSGKPISAALVLQFTSICSMDAVAKYRQIKTCKTHFDYDC